MVGDLLHPYDLSEAVRFKLEFLALSQMQVEEWASSLLALGGHKIITSSWEVTYRGKRTPKLRLEIQCTGQISPEEIWCWIDRLTAFLMTDGLHGRICIGFWLVHIDHTCYGGQWLTTFNIESLIKTVPARHAALWRTPS